MQEMPVELVISVFRSHYLPNMHSLDMATNQVHRCSLQKTEGSLDLDLPFDVLAFLEQQVHDTKPDIWSCFH